MTYEGPSEEKGCNQGRELEPPLPPSEDQPQPHEMTLRHVNATVVSAFSLFCRRGDFVFQTVFSDCWKFKRKEKLNRIKISLFLYAIN